MPSKTPILHDKTIHGWTLLKTYRLIKFLVLAHWVQMTSWRCTSEKQQHTVLARTCVLGQPDRHRHDR